jgi:hypothetical protein
MRIILALKTGLSRSVRAWKGILVSWFISLTMVSLLTVPLKAGLNAAFGKSMVTEKLMKGINFDVLGDLGINLHSIGSSLFAGIILLSLSAIMVNIFIAGGLFDSVRKDSDRATAGNFFSGSAKNFWPFLIISAILYLIVIVLILIVIVVPVSIAGNSESAPEGIVFRILAVSCSVFLAAISIILLVADYARAWQASRMHTESFRALGFGFSQTFRSFLHSFGLIIILLFLQALIGYCVIKIIAGYTPVTGKGVFFLFLISQLLIVLKIFLKVVRFGSITSLMEQNFLKVPVIIEDPVKTDQEYYQDIPTGLKTETDV